MLLYLICFHKLLFLNSISVKVTVKANPNFDHLAFRLAIFSFFRFSSWIFVLSYFCSAYSLAPVATFSVKVSFVQEHPEHSKMRGN